MILKIKTNNFVLLIQIARSFKIISYHWSLRLIQVTIIIPVGTSIITVQYTGGSTLF